MDRKTKNNFFFLVLVFFVFFSWFLAFAEERELEVDYPKVGDIKPNKISITLPEYVKYIFSFAIMVVGVIIFAAMIWGSFVWLTSAGNPSKIKEGREIISSAFLGTIILLSSYIILKIINPELVNLNIKELIPFRSNPPSSALKLPPPKEPFAIFRELSLGQAVEGEQGMWSENSIKQTKKLLFKNSSSSESFEKFLTKKRNIGSQEIKRISDLNKYLQTLTEKCRCGNVTAWCNSPKYGAQGVGCYGDPCERDIREKIERTMSQNENEIKELLEYQDKIKKEKARLEDELRKFNEVEREISLCQYQNREIYNLFEFSSLREEYEAKNEGEKIVILEHNFPAKQDPLTFYCQIGGSISDFPYYNKSPYESDIDDEEKVARMLEKAENIVAERASCPEQVPLGIITDNLRELKILQLAKMERINILINEIVEEIRDMNNLVSECSEKDCEVSCNCIINPCYGICVFCPLRCDSMCLQAVGTCTGEPCPRERIKTKVEEIKKTEDEIFSTLSEIKNIFSKTDITLKAKNNKLNPLNFENLRTSFSLCTGEIDPSTLIRDWELLNCRDAIDSFGPDGAIIANCNPRNYFCCTPQDPSKLKKPISFFDSIPTIIISPKEYPVLKNVNGCPKGWDCNEEVKRYNQYNDTSQSLKQLLSCMREELDTVKEEKNIEQNLGRIVNITDPKLYGEERTCDWAAGPLKEGGCSFPYSLREKKEEVSAHYGGPLCRWQKVSYAVDIGVTNSFEKKYADEIIEAAKKCNPSAYIEYLIPGAYDHIHISLAGVNNCGVD